MAESNAAIQSAAIIGAGTMGRGIAYLFAQKSIRTVLYNRNGNTLNQARDAIVQDLNKKVEQGKLALRDKDAVLANLTFSAEFGAIVDSDLVIETIAEHEQAKLEVLAAIAATVKPDTLIATNTSSLSLNKLATAVTHSERFIGLHFFNPAPLMKLIEIIPAYFTAQVTTERCRQLVAALGKRDVVCQATPGFIVNRMARPYYLEGFRLLEEHVARAPQIDRALKAGGHFRMGPLELTDFIGQDINYQVSRQIWQDMQYDPRYTPGHLQRSLVDAGLLGKKNGRSYFSTEESPRRLRPPSMRSSRRYAFTVNILSLPCYSSGPPCNGRGCAWNNGRHYRAWAPPFRSMTLSPSALPMAARQTSLPNRPRRTPLSSMSP